MPSGGACPCVFLDSEVRAELNDDLNCLKGLGSVRMRVGSVMTAGGEAGASWSAKRASRAEAAFEKWAQCSQRGESIHLIAVAAELS